MKITVLGAGTWGTALGRALSMNHHEVCIWSRFPKETEELSGTRIHPHLPGSVIPDSICFTSDIQTAADHAEYLLMAVPSIYTRETTRDFAPYIRPGTILISAAKGIEKDTLMEFWNIRNAKVNVYMNGAYVPLGQRCTIYGTVREDGTILLERMDSVAEDGWTGKIGK